MKNIQILSLFTFLFFTFSCVEREFDFPDLSGDCFPNDNQTRIRDINQIFSSSTTVASLFTDLNNNPDNPEFGVVDGYVVSSDLGGNFFKTLSVVSVNEDTGAIIRGFNIPIDARNESLVRRFEPGRKITVELKGLYKGIDNDGLSIGELFENNRIGRISNETYAKIVKRNCVTKSEEDLVITGLTIQEAVNNNNLHKLIEFDNVQFKENSLGLRLYEPNSSLNAGSATNHVIEDNQGNEVILRISQFTNFGNQFVPEKSGKIRGVLTKFGTTFQFMVRTINDIKLTEDRFEFDLFPPLGGTDLTYTGSFTENFESYTAGTVTTGQRIFPKYINDANKGGNYWYCESFNNNKYLKMSAFSNNVNFQFPTNRVLFIMPVDFTAANSMSFKTQDRFNVGGVLKVYYSTNYVPLTNVNNATLTDITSNFTIATGTTGSASQPFVNSGVYNFPASLTGNGFIIFEYLGGYSFTPALTTTMHIDDIVVN